MTREETKKLHITIVVVVDTVCASLISASFTRVLEKGIAKY